MYLMFICNEIAVDRLVVSDVYDYVRLVRNLFTIVCNGFFHATACVMCVSLSLYYDVKFGGSHYVMHFLVLMFISCHVRAQQRAKRVRCHRGG